MVKRVKIVALAENWVQKESVRFEGMVEMESYEEREIPKERSVLMEYSFDELVDGLQDIANAIWSLVKGLYKVSKWAVIIIIEGFRWLWNRGVGAEKKKGK